MVIWTVRKPPFDPESDRAIVNLVADVIDFGTGKEHLRAQLARRSLIHVTKSQR
jgi:hypothetical protein